MKCDTCKMKRVCDELERMGKVPKHENCRCYTPTKSVTNYAKIHALDEEGLAAFLAIITTGDRSDRARWLKWLKQEASI